MELSDAQRARYARHLLLPELGEAGQLRLLGARTRAADGADPGTVAVARSYLSRAGLGVATGACEAEVALQLPDTRAVAELAGAPELAEAARALAGAFAAVEAVKAAARIGEQGALQISLAASLREPESEVV